MSARSEFHPAKSESPEAGSRKPETRFSITIEKLGKRFNREWIFKNLTYTFSTGNTYAITGPNGSGKSTLLQVLWGQMPQSAGQINYSHAGKKVAAEAIFQDISIAVPYMDLIDEFTLLEQLEFHFKLRNLRNNLSLEDLLQIMYLAPSRDKYISNFSSGMKQRVKLALAFFTEAKIIFLDEPGTNLDQRAFEWYLKHLDQITGHNLVFIASNQPAEYPPDAARIDILDYK